MRIYYFICFDFSCRTSFRLREHVLGTDNNPLLIFPEGTCVNNHYTVMFKKVHESVIIAVVCIYALLYIYSLSIIKKINFLLTFRVHLNLAAQFARWQLSIIKYLWMLFGIVESKAMF